MPLQRLQLFERPNVEQPDEPVPAGRRYQVSIPAPLERIDHRLVCPSARPSHSTVISSGLYRNRHPPRDLNSQRAQILARPRIPKLDQHVLAPTRHQSFTGVPIHTPHIPSMPTQDLFFLFTPEIPDLDAPIVSPCYELFIVRAKADRSYRFPMGGQGFEVVDGRRIVFEDPALIPGEEE